jgi:hypothetical protein
MYEYDSMLNGKTSRDAYAEKLNEAENLRKAHNLTAKHNSIRNLLSALNIFS